MNKEEKHIEIDEISYLFDSHSKNEYVCHLCSAIIFDRVGHFEWHTQGRRWKYEL